MTCKCQCGEVYPIPAGLRVREFGCYHCGRLVKVVLLSERAQSDPPLRWAVALAAVLVGAMSLVSLAFAAPGDSTERQSFASRTETAAGDAAEAARGRGRMKVINDTGQAIAFRLVGPSAADTQTALIPPWTEKVFDELTAGTWTARYCLGRGWQPELNRFASGGECAELGDRVVLDERIEDGKLLYTVAALRFGSSPREWPAADRITASQFDGD